MLKILLSGLAVAALGPSAFVGAQQIPNQSFKVHQLTPTIYWIEGGGGNSGVVVGDKGVIVIDAKMTPSDGKQLLDRVATITPKPVTTVILTHRDLDHIGGLPAFPKGIDIIAHQVDSGFEAPVPTFMKEKPTIVPPTRVLTENKVELIIDGVTLDLLHWAPAHTSGDTVVYVPAQKVVFAGDILDAGFAAGHIHFDQHGSSAGWIATVKGMVDLDADRYLPGHGDVEDKRAVKMHLDTAETERAQVQKMVAEGKSLDEIRTAIGDPPGGKGPGNDSFATVVYRETTAEPR
jgi:glyoxylase-like metal-dependent hydrolase (beta-lactamase superfamily II)